MLQLRLISGYSLNNLQLAGPTVQNNLFSILLRFRQYAYVIAGDIEKMNRQVEISPDQRNLQRILWPNNRTEEINVFELNTVTYGMKAVSFLAISCLFQLAKENKVRYPKFCDIIENDFYVETC